MVYNTTTNTPNFYNSSQWQSVTTTSAAAMGFKNMRVFNPTPTPTAQTWTVPAGVNKIMLEGWGGGAGGKHYSYAAGPKGSAYLTGNGGGAGGYSMNIVDVTQGLY